MKTMPILKYITIAVIFVVLGFLEGIITNPTPSQKQLEYQSYYKEQASKESLTQNEYEELKNKEAMFLNSPIEHAQVGYLVAFKALFAFIFLAAMFVSYKFILKGTTINQVVLLSAISLVSIFLLVSIFELVVYMVFCISGALLGFQYNKSLNR
jgi:hypothetical protein